MTTDTTYYASPTNRREDGIPVGSADNAEFLRREHDLNIFAVTTTTEEPRTGNGEAFRGP
jgi:hypothetical protein